MVSVTLDASLPGLYLIEPPTDPNCDSLPYIQGACNAVMSEGGGDVWLAPARAGYRLRSGGLALGNGVRLRGLGACGMAGATATSDEWAACGGAWLRPEHSTAPAVTLLGHGSAIEGVGFVHDQPAPCAGWEPRTYGWCIDNRAVFTSIADIAIVNASHGIALQGTESSGGGTHVRVRDCIVSAFNTCLRTSYLNDTAAIRNLHFRNLSHSSDPAVVDWIRKHTVGWHCLYTDNPMVKDMEFFEAAIGILLQDETCLGIRHSLYNGQIECQFNLPTVCMRVAAADTTVLAQMPTVLAQTGNAFGLLWDDPQFDLRSDNVDIRIGNLTVNDAGGTIAQIGAGTSGRLSIDNLDVKQFGSVDQSAPAFDTALGAQLEIGTVTRFGRGQSQGPLFAGPGPVRMAVYDRPFFTQFSGAGGISGAGGTWVDVSTSSIAKGRIQARLSGSVFLSSVKPNASCSFRMSGNIGVRADLSGSLTGWQTIDSGWVDLPEGAVGLGRLQFQAPVGVTIGLAELNLLER